MKLQNLIKIVPSISLALAVCCMTSCGGRKGGLPQSNEFPVATAETSSTILENSYPAVIKGKQDIEIRPKVAGFITKLCVEEGASVKAGQVLFTIDNVQYKATYNKAEANFTAAKSSLATAELTFKNKQELFKQGIIGDYDLQAAENNYAAAKAGLAQAQAAVMAARDDLNYCNVTSPANGVIGTIPYRVGSLVSSAITTPLTTVSNISEMYVYFSMTEKQLLELTRENTSKNLADAFPAVKLRLADGTEYEHPGKVNMVSGVIDQATGSVSVRADFSNPDNLLKSGGTGSIVMHTEASNVIIIPQSATTEVQNKRFIYKVGKDNKVAYTEIKVNPRDDGKTFIVTDGLKVGERYVVAGLTKLTNNQEIVVLSEAEYKKKLEEAQQLGSIQGDYKKMKEAFSKK